MCRLQIFEFFKQRISLQYPEETQQLDPFVVVKESHEAFMKAKAECVLGRKDILDQVSVVMLWQSTAAQAAMCELFYHLNLKYM